MCETDVMMEFVRSHLELEIWLMMKLFIWIPFVSDSRAITYVVTCLNWTPKFVVKYGHQKDVCEDKIGHCAQHKATILFLIL